MYAFPLAEDAFSSAKAMQIKRPGINLVYGKGDKMSRCKVLIDNKVIITHGFGLGQVMTLRDWYVLVGAKHLYLDSLGQVDVIGDNHAIEQANAYDCSTCVKKDNCGYFKAMSQENMAPEEVVEEVLCKKPPQVLSAEVPSADTTCFWSCLPPPLPRKS
jgi:hypothetical protein